MPGIGIEVPSRQTTSAASVNRMGDRRAQSRPVMAVRGERRRPRW
jgi:hypothetical protein